MSVDAALPDNGGLVPTDDVLDPKLTAKESVPAPPDDEVGDEEDPQASPKEGESEHETQKRLSGYERQKRARARAEQERDFWRDQFMEQKSHAPTPKAEPVAEPQKDEFVFSKPRPEEPVEEDFTIPGTDTYDRPAFLAARKEYPGKLLDWGDERRDAKEQWITKKADERKQQEAVRKDAAGKAQLFNERQAKFEAEHPDYNEYADRACDIWGLRKPHPPEHIGATILESDLAPNILHYFGQHEDEAKALLQMNQVKAIKEIGRIEAKLEAQFAKEESAEGEQAEEPPSPPQSKAPEPIHPVSKPSAAAKPFDPVRDADLPYKEWVKKREAQLQRK